ncbi:PP2C family serine/threonine-protein phosphatase [Massilia sp. CF038]|uniref:PP2C family protein-serine/threonine phosphatase n=1 Tax=Massilia sp. CF038 TaxID=1881045 RepID=UPI0009109184|nr:protein phosphatase 2C domain-containing protein [Massilia sp. CF038]SHG97325.1 protein phosphatase [Massilia sp. CF038]
MYVWKPLSPSQPEHLALGIAFGMTDIGKVRVSNEDNFLIDCQLGLVAVADGMGGHEAGEVASSDALLSLSHYIRTLDDHANPLDFGASTFDAAAADPLGEWSAENTVTMTALHDAVEFANQRMFHLNMENQHAEGAGMGTTLTGFWQPDPSGPLFVFHVGDTRLYRLRAGRLNQLTRDQTMYQHAIELGIRHNLPGRNLLLQALGPSAVIRPELQVRNTAPGDIYMLCSDGLHGATAHDDMADILTEAGPAGLGEACSKLIDLAKQGGSRDNITVVLLHCH